jgi:type IV secretory pathway component VirB8
MEQDILKKLEEQEKKIDAIFVSVERTRKYFMWTLIISVAVIVLPLIGVAALLPTLLNSIALPAGL